MPSSTSSLSLRMSNKNVYIMRNSIIVIFCVLAFGLSAAAQDGKYVSVNDVPYVGESETDEYRLEACLADLYYPEDVEGFPTVIWFHGGGLTGGVKHLPVSFRDRGIAVVSVGYRLSPRATCPAYLEDAAEAVAWVFNHISEYGGDPEKIFIAGHSAGGYLTLMMGLDKSWLEKFGVDADKIRKLYPISGQTMTHYTIRAERGLSQEIPIIDEYAPVSHIRREGAPIMLITGDKDLEMTARYEESAYLDALLRNFGHPTQLFQLGGFNHGNVCEPACQMIAEDVWNVIGNDECGRG